MSPEDHGGIMTYNLKPVQASLSSILQCCSFVRSDTIRRKNTKNFRITGHEICLTFTSQCIWKTSWFDLEHTLKQWRPLSPGFCSYQMSKSCNIQSKYSLPMKFFALSGMLNKPRNWVLTRVNINIRSYLWAHLFVM